MPSVESNPVFWITKIIACALMLQAVELIQIRRAYSNYGIWKWATLRREFEIFPRVIQWMLNAVLDYPRFLSIVCAQVGLAAALLVLEMAHPAVLIGLLMTTGLIALRWRGTFNGGADYMTLLVLMVLTIEALFRSSPAGGAVRLGCLWYLSVQTVFSYFFSGVVKIRNTDWWSGRALQRFLSSPPYDPPEFFVRLSKSRQMMMLGSWTILIFEVSFPFALYGSTTCAAFLGAALLFHVLNFATFGLNRFIFTWSAAYPALYYCSLQKIG